MGLREWAESSAGSLRAASAGGIHSSAVAGQLMHSALLCCFVVWCSVLLSCHFFEWLRLLFSVAAAQCLAAEGETAAA